MKSRSYNIDDLARLRMSECQGTLIGGMQIAKGLGLDPEEYGYRMMTAQRIDWQRIAGDLSGIGRIFSRHYQVTYDFGPDLKVTMDGDLLQFEMPSITDAASGQLSHWNAAVADFESVQRGFWRAIERNAGVSVSLSFEPHRHVVTVRKV